MLKFINNVILLRFMFLIFAIPLFAINPKANNMAKAFVENTSEYTSNSEVKTHTYYKDNYVFTDRQELTMTEQNLLNEKNGYINRFHNVYCPVLKPIMNYDVVFKINVFDYLNNYVFNFYLDCKKY